MWMHLRIREAIGLASCLAMAAAVIALFAAPVSRGQSPAPPAGKPRGASVPDPNAAALDELLAKGQASLESNDYAAAATAYEQYITKKPDDASAHFQLGYAYTALKRTANARAEYKRATELDPQMGDAFLNLGLTEVDSDPVAAIAALRKAVELMPDDAHPKFMLGAALDHSGKIPEAIEQYKAAAAIDDQDPAVHRALGNALLRTSRAAEAEPEIRAAIGLEDDPRDRLELAECLVAEHKMDEGAAEFTAYLKANPADTTTRFAFASMLINQTKYDEALAQLNSVGGSGPEALQAWKLRYEALSGLKRADEATAALLRAETIDPGDPDVHSELGNTYLAKKNYPGAAHEFQAAVKINPADKQSTAALVGAEYSAGDFAGTLQAVELQAQQSPALPLTSLFIRASCYDKLGQKKEALGAYEAFLAANQDQTSDAYFAAAQRARDLHRELGNRK
jgi:tetratricopeptide (TPR) repeat protein